MSRTPLTRSRSFYYLYPRRHRRNHDLFLTSSSSPHPTPDRTPLNPFPSFLLHYSSSSNRARNSLSRLFRSNSQLVRSTVPSLAKEILSSSNNDDLASVLDSDSTRSIICLSADGNCSPFVKLLTLLKPRPQLALQIFHRRRNLPDSPPLKLDEYASAITLAGRAHNLALAVKLFYESISTAHHPILYNAFMSAFERNGDLTNTIHLFDKLKKETKY